MKQTIMGIGLIVGVLVGFVPSVDAQTQKKPVDIEACMSWKRVESPDISPTGRWVTYRIAPMEYLSLIHILEDDKYAIEQLAQRHSFIDGKKVGIYGHSGGGFMAAAAICTYPDFYKAAVSCAGNHDNSIYNRGW